MLPSLKGLPLSLEAVLTYRMTGLEGKYLLVHPSAQVAEVKRCSVCAFFRDKVDLAGVQCWVGATASNKPNELRP